MKLGPDGSWTIVLSRREPGVPNWVSTADRLHGLIWISVSAAGGVVLSGSRTQYEGFRGKRL
ncbi:MAG: hypothetical protein O7B23_05755, partial [Deltaproteobacteria bacterium]|nr:hypothetical protein [Deltaproteobacteria bacterium]